MSVYSQNLLINFFYISAWHWNDPNADCYGILFFFFFYKLHVLKILFIKLWLKIECCQLIKLYCSFINMSLKLSRGLFWFFYVARHPRKRKTRVFILVKCSQVCPGKPNFVQIPQMDLWNSNARSSVECSVEWKIKVFWTKGKSLKQFLYRV